MDKEINNIRSVIALAVNVFRRDKEKGLLIRGEIADELEKALNELLLKKYELDKSEKE